MDSPAEPRGGGQSPCGRWSGTLNTGEPRPGDETAAGPLVPDDLGIPGLVDAAVVGRGGFGVVYRARQPELNRVVAVKVMSTILDGPSQVRFAREGYAMGTVAGHPHIVQVLSVGVTAGGRPYLLMPLLAGGSLAERIPLPWDEAVTHTVKLCGALETAHRAGVLHRDLKPANVLLSAFGEPQLADFGISRVSGGYETSEGLVSASVPYAAPEIFSGGTATVGADVYSLAATLFAAIAGSPPFGTGSGEELVATYLRISRDPVPDLRPHGVPGPVAAALEAGLAKDPAQRPASAADLGRLLQDAQRACDRPVTAMALTPDAIPDLPSADVKSADEASYTPTTGERAADEPAPVPTVWYDPAERPVPLPGGRRAKAAAALVAVVALGVGAVQWWPDGGETAAGTPPASTDATPGGTPTGAPGAVAAPGSRPAGLDKPKGIAVAADGTTYFADEKGDRVVRRSPGGTFTTYAGSGAPASAAAALPFPAALAFGPDGTLYVGGDGYVRRADEKGNLVDVSGFDRVPYLGVADMSFGPDGLYVLAAEKLLLRAEDGKVSTVPGAYPDVNAIAAHPGGGLLVSEGDQVFRLARDGTRTVVAGSGNAGDGKNDGQQAARTRLSTPGALAFDRQGRLHIAEVDEARVRRVESDGTLVTVAGSPDGYVGGDAGDGGPAVQASFGLVKSLAFDAAGNLYIGDETNRRVRRVTPGGTIEAFA